MKSPTLRRLACACDGCFDLLGAPRKLPLLNRQKCSIRGHRVGRGSRTERPPSPHSTRAFTQ